MEVLAEYWFKNVGLGARVDEREGACKHGYKNFLSLLLLCSLIINCMNYTAAWVLYER